MSSWALSALAALPLLAPSAPAPERAAAPKDVFAAMERALSRTPGFVIEVVREEEEDSPVWEAKILGRGGRVTEVEVCGETGGILAVERVIMDRDLQELRPQRTRFSAQQIARRALAHRGGAIVEIEQDRLDNGRLGWDVYIKSARDGKVHELEFDARTGDFLGLEVSEDE